MTGVAGRLVESTVVEIPNGQESVLTARLWSTKLEMSVVVTSISVHVAVKSVGAVGAVVGILMSDLSTDMPFITGLITPPALISVTAEVIPILRATPAFDFRRGGDFRRIGDRLRHGVLHSSVILFNLPLVL